MSKTSKQIALLSSIRQQVAAFDAQLATLLEAQLAADPGEPEVTVPRIVEYAEAVERVLHAGPRVDLIEIPRVVLAIDEAIQNTALHVKREVYDPFTSESVVREFLEAFERQSPALGPRLNQMLCRGVQGRKAKP